jgi:outer membrane protein assembly factor BamB
VWPAWVILGLTGVAWVVSVTPAINNLTRFIVMMVGPLAGAVLSAVWMLGFSRLGWRERLLVPLIALALGLVTWQISHADMGVTVWIYGVPLALAAIAIGETLWRDRLARPRIGLVAALLVVAWGWLPFVRIEGFRGDYFPELTWRWTPTKESLLAPAVIPPTVPVAEAAITPATKPFDPENLAAYLSLHANDWPNFRGTRLQGRAESIQEPLDWEKQPPTVLWKQPIGPGWSSFIYVTGKLYTQEQRGEQELVSCYDAATGKPVWQSAHPTRFSEVVSGAGPRATPTYDQGQLFTFGAKGLLTCHNAENGRVIWQRDLMKEVGAQLPMWGFSGSPIVVGHSLPWNRPDMTDHSHRQVIVYAGGSGDNGLMAFDCTTGKTDWAIKSKGMNFSSAQPIGENFRHNMIVFGDEDGLFAVEPATQKILWRFRPSEWKGPAMCQPLPLFPLALEQGRLPTTDSLIVTLGDGIGVARLEMKFEPDSPPPHILAGDHSYHGTFSVREVWTSNQFKPSFNDMVYHKGHLYGFDQNILVCLDIETGQRKWKKGRYGFGQMLLLPKVDQLIVLSEQGESVLVAADPTAHRELGRVQAIEGKTWNHPIIAGQTLYLRNGEEATALRLVP